MKKLVLASLALAALASCSKESTVDVSISSAQIPMQFSTYSSSATTKGNPIDSNSEFQEGDNPDAPVGGTFKVSAYTDTEDTNNTISKYFGFSDVAYNTTSDKWVNLDEMYYPNVSTTIYFGAYAPADAIGLGTGLEYEKGTNKDADQKLTLPYTVVGDYPAETAKTVDDQDDLMYAITELSYVYATTNGANDDASFDSGMEVNLHFKHALTQIEFTATKDKDIDVTVKSITLCNIINGGTFVATSKTDVATTGNLSDNTMPDANVETADMGAWATTKVQNHYIAAMNETTVGGGVVVAATSNNNGESPVPTQLTNVKNALMLIPQQVEKWVYTDTDDTGAQTEDATAAVAGTTSYLAIDCIITHTGSTEPIINGIVYVPFGSEGIKYNPADNTAFATTYNGKWAPGYKITYNLDFGGGYTDPTPGTPTIPDPGYTPDPEDLVPTLRPITYTTSVDEWKTPESGSDSDSEINLGGSSETQD